jgi:hypothetical protein
MVGGQLDAPDLRSVSELERGNRAWRDDGNTCVSVMTGDTSVSRRSAPTSARAGNGLRRRVIAPIPFRCLSAGVAGGCGNGRGVGTCGGATAADAVKRRAGSPPLAKNLQDIVVRREHTL